MIIDRKSVEEELETYPNIYFHSLIRGFIRQGKNKEMIKSFIDLDFNELEIEVKKEEIEEEIKRLQDNQSWIINNDYSTQSEVDLNKISNQLKKIFKRKENLENLEKNEVEKND